MAKSETSPPIALRFIDAENKFIIVGGNRFAYRELGKPGGTPLVLLNHWGAVLDNFDPQIVDRLASQHHTIALNFRGIGGSGGEAPTSIDEMARDTIATIHALGFEKIKLMGFSLGGFVAQDVTLKVPELVEKLILTGTGPADGVGIANVGKVSWPLILRGMLTLRDPKNFLFFTQTKNGKRAAKDFLSRIAARKIGRDTPPSIRAFIRQLTAIEAWGRQAPQDLASITIPVLVANGESDIMVPSSNSYDLARRIPNAQLVIYEDAGHGGIFQNYADFSAKALKFLGA